MLSRPLLGRMCCLSTCHTGVFWRMEDWGFNPNSRGPISRGLEESSQRNLRILVQVKLSSFTRGMIGEHHEVNSGPVTLHDTTGKSLAWSQPRLWFCSVTFVLKFEKFCLVQCGKPSELQLHLPDNRGFESYWEILVGCCQAATNRSRHAAQQLQMLQDKSLFLLG